MKDKKDKIPPLADQSFSVYTDIGSLLTNNIDITADPSTKLFYGDVANYSSLQAVMNEATDFEKFSSGLPFDFCTSFKSDHEMFKFLNHKSNVQLFKDLDINNVYDHPDDFNAFPQFKSSDKEDVENTTISEEGISP